METSKQDEGRLLLINKPIDWTSFDVVNKLRNRLKIKKIGHAGTLDPLASGLLIICAGKMTKQIDQFMGLEKEYTGTFTIGQTTPSHDLETEVSAQVDITSVTNDQIYTAAQSFVGVVDQLPPLHSAIKIGGKRAYKFARKGQDVELKKRSVEIREFEITSIQLPQIHFRIVCSKGTYIRSIARDLGETLGVGAYLSQLCRTRIGAYRLENAVSIDDVMPVTENADLLRP